MKYIPALDGVRGLSVLAVILAHGYLTCGWIGVQVFFVLSGYLITEKLLEDGHAPLTAYLRRFYRRRVVRIFPLYYLYLAVLTLAFLVMHKPQTFSVAWGWLYTYLYNFKRVAGLDAESPYFSHLWSLSIEEQFYLFWPLLVYWRGKARLAAPLMAVIIAAPLLRYWLGYEIAGDAVHVGNAIYNFTPCQVDAFAVGAGIVLVKDRVPQVRPLFWVSVALIVAAGVFVVGSWGAYPARPTDLSWMYSLVNLSAGLLVLYALRHAAPLLNWRPLVYLGKISYGVYVYHYGLKDFLFTQLHIADGSRAAALLFLPYVALLIALASVSYYGFEKRLLRFKSASEDKQLAIGVGA